MLPFTPLRHPILHGISLRLGGVLVGCCMAASARAQTDIPDPSAELQRQDRQRQEQRERMEIQARSPSGALQATPAHQQLPHEQPCTRIARVRIQSDFASAAIQAALRGVQADDPPDGRCLGSQGVTLLIQRAQQALAEQGYITSQVYAPEQDLNQGELVLHVKPGRVTRIRAASEPTSLPRWLWAIEEGDVLNLRAIEQSSENLQRLPSLLSKIQIEPGNTPDSSDLVVDIQARRPLRLSVTLDDAGTKATGKVQGSAALSWDNPLGLGDLFYLSQGKDMDDKEPGPRGSRSQIVHYSVPWAYWLFSATWSDNSYQQTVYGPYESYLYSGTSGQQEIAVSRVLHRDASSKTTASVKGFARQSKNYVADLEVLVQRRRSAGWEATLQHLHYLQAGTLMAQLSYRQGTGAFEAQPAPEEITGQGTAHMRLMNAVLHWSMPFHVDQHPWQYSAQVQWQGAQTRLTPQDRFCVGGRSTVRGFDGQQTLCGDEGQLLRQELATGLPKTWDMSGVQAYAALDAARANTPRQESAYELIGFALGVRGQHKWPGNYPLQWDVFVGQPLSHPQGFSTAQYTAGFSVRAEF